MFKKLFGFSEPDAWASAPDGLRRHVEGMLSSQELVGLERALLKHEVFSRVKPECWQVDAAKQAQVLSLALLDAHWVFVSSNPRTLEEVMSRTRSDARREARWLVYASVRLNSEPWNPSWSWCLFYAAAELDETQKKMHVTNTLHASDTAGDWYFRILGREPAYELVYPNIRALAVYLSMELVLLERLSTADQETYSSVMALKSDGVTVKLALMRLLAAVPRSSEDAVAFGLRWVSHAVHLVGRDALSKLEFGKMLPAERCAAAINPQHLPSRLDLALLLRDLGHAEPDSGYADEALRYAGEALALIDGGQYDLGPNAELGINANERDQEIEDMRGKMLEILR